MRTTSRWHHGSKSTKKQSKDIKIYVTNVHVNDQDKAEAFHTDVLSFKVKSNILLGESHWLTVVSGEELDGTELLLETSKHPAVKLYKEAPVFDAMPAHSFQVENLDPERVRLVHWA
ncbi:MAG: hypothetical protein ACR2OJ_17050, partial [Hyphomicrobiales bacterium]